MVLSEDDATDCFVKIMTRIMNIPFLSLKDVTALHGSEINEAVSLS